MNRNTFRKLLQILAVLCLVGFVGVWAALGADTGWTKTSIPVKVVDEITGIESQTWEDKFVPGMDFLGAGLVAAVLLGGGSFLVRKR